jgi:hypothetical protein
MDAKIEQWQEVISQWRESGQTQKDFCRTRDIKLSTLHYWMKRVKKTSTAQAALPGLVRIAPPATSGGSTEIIIEIDLLSGKCNDPGSARELTHLNPSRL